MFESLSDQNCRKLIKLSHESDDVQLNLNSKYKLSATIDGLIQKMQFPNTNYGKKNHSKSVHLQNVREILRNKNVLPDHLPLPVINIKIPKFFVGAYVDLGIFLSVIFRFLVLRWILF